MVPRGQLYVMDQAGHHLQEERPHEFYAVVSGFLESVKPSAPTRTSAV